MATAKLHYFNGRGRGEVVRLSLAAAGINFTEEFITERQQLLDLIDQGKLVFDQLPLLEIDGKKLVQSGSIVRYLGRKAGLFGKNEDEAVLVDIYYDGARDFHTPILPVLFLPEEDVLETAKTKTLPKYLPHFEKIAAANGTGFLVGNSLTIADIGLLEALLIYVEYLGQDIFKDYPALKKFYKVVTSVDKIAAFLKGPQRKKKNDDRYVADVKRVLAWN